jgi:osmotically inducible protein OsmC
MAVRTATAEWKGDLKGGSGTLETESGAVQTGYSFGTRFGEERGTNPEELIGAAHAGCFSMALANMLAQAGHTPTSIRTEAKVKLEMLEGGPTITRIDLRTRGKVPGMDEGAFVEQAERAKGGCPVSRALKAVEITLDAKLED